MDKMNQYMSEHNYGKEDAEIYKKDPEWQKLNEELLKEDGEDPVEIIAENEEIEIKDTKEQKSEYATVSAREILGTDSSDKHFWEHHNNKKEDYMLLASKLPEVQKKLKEGMKWEDIKKNPELSDCVEAYYNPEKMIKVELTERGYEFQDDGRHRVAAARELGYEIPVNVIDRRGNQTQSAFSQSKVNAEDKKSGFFSKILKKREKEKVIEQQPIEPVNQILQINEKAELNEECLDAVPEFRRKEIYQLFKNSPQEVKMLLKNHADDLQVGDTTDDNVSCYDMKRKKIYMEEILDNEEYAEVFSHEYGHMADDFLGNVSGSTEFREAFQKDLKMYDREEETGNQRFKTMIQQAVSTEAAYDRMLSDNLSAAFLNDRGVIDTFNNAGIAYYGHRDEYWTRSGNREAEMFANCFSIYSSGTTESCSFMNQYFPNTWNTMIRSLKRGVK